MKIIRRCAAALKARSNTKSEVKIMNDDIKCDSQHESDRYDCGYIHTEYWREKTCPVCGKIFYPPSDEWGYKEGESLICSWHCLCELRRRNAASVRRICRRTGKAASPRLRADQIKRRNENIRFDFAQGDSVKTLGCRYGLSYTHIKRIISAAPKLSEACIHGRTATKMKAAEKSGAGKVAAFCGASKMAEKTPDTYTNLNGGGVYGNGLC